MRKYLNKTSLFSFNILNLLLRKSWIKLSYSAGMNSNLPWQVNINYYMLFSLSLSLSLSRSSLFISSLSLFSFYLLSLSFSYVSLSSSFYLHLSLFLSFHIYSYINRSIVGQFRIDLNDFQLLTFSAQTYPKNENCDKILLLMYFIFCINAWMHICNYDMFRAEYKVHKLKWTVSQLMPW